MPQLDGLFRVSLEQFGARFMNWVKSIAELTQGQVVAVYGKTLRGDVMTGAKGVRPCIW